MARRYDQDRQQAARKGRRDAPFFPPAGRAVPLPSEAEVDARMQEELEEDEDGGDGDPAAGREEDRAFEPWRPAPALPVPSGESTEALREEFKSIMKARFLAGFSQDVDYDAIDSNAELDHTAVSARGGWAAGADRVRAQTVDRDMEDRYFDNMEDDDPPDHGTGVTDY